MYLAEGFTEPIPSLVDRNREQFWIFESRESGVKGGEMPTIMPRKIDEMFNLTTTYRQERATEMYTKLSTKLVYNFGLKLLSIKLSIL